MIIVHNLNKLRWLYPNQIFLDNRLNFTDAYTLNRTYDILKKNQISFTVK